MFMLRIVPVSILVPSLTHGPTVQEEMSNLRNDLVVSNGMSILMLVTLEKRSKAVNVHTFLV